MSIGFENTMEVIIKSFLYIPLAVIAITLLILYANQIATWRENNGPWKDFPGIKIVGFPFFLVFYVLKFIFVSVIWNFIQFFINKETRKLFFDYIKQIWKNHKTIIKLLSLMGIFSISVYYWINGSITNMDNMATIVNYTLIIIGIILALSLFLWNFKELYTTDKYGPDGNLKTIMKKSGVYLFYIICLGLALGLLAAFTYFSFSYNIVSITSLWFLNIIGIVATMFILYTQLKKIPLIKNLLTKSRLFELLYNLIFILPCLFMETAQYIYRQFKNTPNTVYKVFFAELVIIVLFILIPILKRTLYTTMPSNSNKNDFIQNQIDSVDIETENLEKEIAFIKITKNENPTTKINLSNSTWNKIIEKRLFLIKNTEELKTELINNGITTSSDIDQILRYIQKNTEKIMLKTSQIKDLKFKKEKMKKQLENYKRITKAKVLIMEPKYLNTKHDTDDDGNIMTYENITQDSVLEQYSYNYAISCWIFLHSQPPNYAKTSNKYASIFNYNNKPKISYNSKKNILKIEMNNGLGKKIIYENKKFPLQKWHNIVINYNNGVLDIFINAKLVASYPNVVPYMSMDKISLGENDGVSGGICNVVYFPQYISKTRIDTNYYLFKEKNPPI
jgi:hypothetical protein